MDILLADSNCDSAMIFDGLEFVDPIFVYWFDTFRSSIDPVNPLCIPLRHCN